MSCDDSLMTCPTSKKMHHWRKMPEQITINSLVNSIKKGSGLTQRLLTANHFLKSWTKVYSGSSFVGCAHGVAEMILPEGMQSSQYFSEWEKGGRYQLGRDMMGSFFCISVFSYLPLFSLASYCLVFVLKMSQNLWSFSATCDSWHPAEIACWIIMPSLHGTALSSCETEQVLTNPSNIILSKTCAVMCSLAEYGSTPLQGFQSVWGCSQASQSPSLHTHWPTRNKGWFLKLSEKLLHI